jgi:hydroxymethylpyrimidine pyrophosphatase-like HAD family hydrolase
MPDITLVAFDLDGTLLDSANRIRRDSLAALTRLQEEGVFVTSSQVERTLPPSPMPAS